MFARHPTTRSLLAACITLAFVLAGCMQPLEAEPGPRVEFREHAQLGPILTDAAGMTLYVFTNDDPGVSNCAGGCLEAWPAFLADEVPPAPDEISGKLGLVERTDGSMQVAYDDRPLYYFASDAAAGEARGDGLNGVWFVVRTPPTNAEMLNGEGPSMVDSEEVEYGPESMGYLAMPQGAEASTGVVMIHEWWGLNENIRAMADLLASHGYAVLAVDLFNGSVATTSDEALQQVQNLDQGEATANMRAAADFLRDEGATNIASLGWCFGGGQSLQLAISGEPLGATIIYYGTPVVTDEDRLDAVGWPVLGIFGEDDQAIPVSTVRSFEDALDNLSIENDIYVYPDVGHAFANPSGDAWAPEQTKDAWARTLDFLVANAA